MLTDSEEEKKEIKTRKHRSLSKPDDLSRNKHQSPNQKQTTSAKSRKDEIKYQRFVRSLRKDIKMNLNIQLRENGFDPSGNRPFSHNSIVKSRRTNQSNPMKLSNTSPKKLLVPEIQAILASPALKSFYNQFVQPQNKNPTSTTRSHPHNDSNE